MGKARRFFGGLWGFVWGLIGLTITALVFYFLYHAFFVNKERVRVEFVRQGRGAQRADVRIISPFASRLERGYNYEKLGGGRIRCRPPEDSLTAPGVTPHSTLLVFYANAAACERGNWTITTSIPGARVIANPDPCQHGWTIITPIRR